MVTKGYIVRVYDENGNRLDNSEGFVKDASKVAQADVWLPIFDDSDRLTSNSTVGRADMCVIPHTKIPLSIQTKDRKSACLCAIQDFDLSTLVILGYLNNKNNDDLAPYANMHLAEFEVNKKTTLHGETKVELSARGCDVNRLTPGTADNSGFFVSQHDIEALYGAGADDGVKNIQKAFTNVDSITQSIASATGLYSITLNQAGSNRMDKPTLNLTTWAYQLETYNVTYTFKYTAAGMWTLFKGPVQQGSAFSDISVYGLTLNYKAGYSYPAIGTEIYVTFNSAIPVTSGGTGANSASQARENLGILSTEVLSQSDFNKIATTSYSPNTLYYIYGE